MLTTLDSETALYPNLVKAFWNNDAYAEASLLE